MFASIQPCNFGRHTFELVQLELNQEIEVFFFDDVRYILLGRWKL